MQEYPELNAHKHTHLIMVTRDGVRHETTVNTYGNFDVFFAAIKQATGLSGADPIPKGMVISTKRLEDNKYYGVVP